MSCEGFVKAPAVAGSGCLSVLLRVPRPSASSFTYAKRPGSPIQGHVESSRIRNFLSQLEAWYVCRSEIKGEPAQQAEDIRGDGYTVALAGSAKFRSNFRSR